MNYQKWCSFLKSLHPSFLQTLSSVLQETSKQKSTLEASIFGLPKQSVFDKFIWNVVQIAQYWLVLSLNLLTSLFKRRYSMLQEEKHVKNLFCIHFFLSSSAEAIINWHNLLMKTNMDDEAPMINKYGDFIYSKKYKLLHSLDKTNLKK